MKIIGITGPTGAGKTTALRAFERKGARVIDCDAVYHSLLRSSRPMKEELRRRFGTDVFDAEGQLDRKALGGLVYEDEAAMKDLEAITHRYVGEEVDRLIALGELEGRDAVAVDAIALIEGGLALRCDATIAVLASEQQRLKRIMEREGVSEAYAQARIHAQKEDDYYRTYCTYVLENNGDEAAFAGQAEALYDNIVGISREEQLEKRTGAGLLKEKRSVSVMEENKAKSLADQKRELLLHNEKNGYDRLLPEEEKAMGEYCEAYKCFLNHGKTERECTAYAVALAQERGFKPYERGMAIKPGDKVYRVNRGKAVILAVIGSEPMGNGVNICAAHIDAPRLDLKPMPLYEDDELAYLKTHYYGGIRKYHWVTTPLELHGVVVKRDGTVIPVSVGDGENDPQFVITDLLPHLAAEQSKKPLGEAIAGETLNILVGSRPFKDDEGARRVKLAIMDILNEKYGMTETDFISAELSAVPAGKAVDIGFDRSLIGGYGHDDRSCSYAALAALLNLDRIPTKTAVCMLADKEEIGSTGTTGMKSANFDTFISDLCDAQNAQLKACFENSFCLSADVTAAFDPNFQDVYEKRNSARINYGLGFCKYTGARGKSGCSDASAEVVAYVRRVMDEAKVIWQMAELGKVDAGGGGTVAAYMAERDINTLDAGVPVLSMHAPFEIVSKLDCYMTYKGMKAVYEAK